MRILILVFTLLGTGLLLGCSDNSNQQASQAADQASSDQSNVSVGISTKENSASFSNGDVSISVNKADTQDK